MPVTDIREQLDRIEETILSGLKPFQRATAEHIASLYEQGMKRVLLADEVGLGKTLVARGVVAKIASLRKREHDDLVKVVYICSNSSIASQNLRKLQIHDDVQLSDSANSRLSMQHLRLAQEACDSDLKRRYVQLIPLTPGTSFALQTGQGTLPERALMLAVLEFAPEFQGEANSERLRRLRSAMWAKRGNMVEGNWNWQCWNARNSVEQAREGLRAPGAEVSPALQDYPHGFLALVRQELEHERVTLEQFIEYLDAGEPQPDIPFENRAITSLRRAFSKASMDMMDPDFVIMDEFQRFRSLVSSDDTEMGMLAKRFFNSHTRVLLLSATPFRMYMTRDEASDGSFGNSSREFHEVMGFLADGHERVMARFREIWHDYARSLMGAAQGDAALLLACRRDKATAERAMLTHIARTERTSTHEMSDLVLDDPGQGSLAVRKEDIQAYFTMQAIADAAGVRRGLLATDYAKSCPYPLSFMRYYKFNAALDAGAKKNWAAVERELGSRRWNRLWINRGAINGYKPLDVRHARYQKLKADVLDDSEAGLLLWVPPSIC